MFTDSTPSGLEFCSINFAYVNIIRMILMCISPERARYYNIGRSPMKKTLINTKALKGRNKLMKDSWNK